MKSLFLLCEYGISPVMVNKLLDNGITIENLIENIDKIKKINGISFEKIKIMKLAVNHIKNDEKKHSVYELYNYDITITVIDKLFNNNINLDSFSIEELKEKGITNATSQKIEQAYIKYIKDNNIEITLNNKSFYKFIKKKFNHNIFNLKKLEKIFADENLNKENIESLLNNKYISKIDNEFYLMFDINDLEDYGLKQNIILELKEKNIELSDISIDLLKENLLNDNKISAIIESYNIFLKKEKRYIPNISSRRLLEVLKEKFKSESFKYNNIEKIFIKEKISINNLKNKLEYLKNNNKINFNNDTLEYNVNYTKLKDVINNIEDINNCRTIMIRKLNGETLEKIGKSYNLTRERIRQIFSKTFNKINTVFEDKYAKTFIKYNYDIESFCELFKEEKIVYYYLKEKYSKGKENLKKLVYDQNITEPQKSLIMKKYNLIKYNNEIINIDKVDIIIAILKKNKIKMEYKELIEEYNEFIYKNNLNLEKLNENENKNVDSILIRSRLILNSLNKSMRYYDLDSLNNEQIMKLKSFLYLKEGVYSTKLFFENNKQFMEQINILDEYELHNLLKKKIGEINNIKYSRMPDIRLGYNDTIDFIEEKIREYDSMEIESFCEYIYKNYGHTKQRIKGILFHDLYGCVKKINNKNYIYSDLL